MGFEDGRRMEVAIFFDDVYRKPLLVIPIYYIYAVYGVRTGRFVKIELFCLRQNPWQWWAIKKNNNNKNTKRCSNARCLYICIYIHIYDMIYMYISLYSRMTTIVAEAARVENTVDEQ